MKLLIALAATAIVVMPATAKIACRDTKTGRAMKCPPKGVAVATAGGQVSAPDKTGRCHVVVPAPGTKQKKGQMVTCPKG